MTGTVIRCKKQKLTGVTSFAAIRENGLTIHYAGPLCWVAHPSFASLLEPAPILSEQAKMYLWLILAVLTTDPVAPVAGPLSPDASLKALHHAEEVTVSLVAHEPQVIDPVSARFDALGRLWVVEMRDYPTGPLEGQMPQGTIKILRDKDGDGFYETATTFISGLWFPTGVQPWRDGVIVTLAGSIEYMRDVDHDDVCDQREVWFEGFAADNTQLRANHPLLAPDGKIYIANGLRSGQIVSKDPRWPSRDAPIPLTGRDFTFAPQGASMEQRPVGASLECRLMMLATALFAVIAIPVIWWPSRQRFYRVIRH